MIRLLSIAVLTIGALAAPVDAQDGAFLFKTYCAICHEGTAANPARGPERAVLRQMTPEHILAVLETGAMKSQAAERSRAQRRVLAEYLSEKKFGSAPVERIPAQAYCDKSASAAFRQTLTGPAWNGWSPTRANNRFQPASAAQLTAAEVPRLKLKWAFAYPGATSAGSQPTVAGGRIYTGTAEGDVYALDARTGCVYWTAEADAAVRTAITIGETRGGRLAAFFGDQGANVYAVDAENGKRLWKTKVDDYALTVVTGAPALYDGRLYVGVSSREESQAPDPRYPCCGFRGSVSALDSSNGEVLWKTYTIADEAHETGKNALGTPILGPSGAPVWNSPTIDAKRGRLYFGTGNNYSNPATAASDAIVAADLRTGKIVWVRQVVEQDAWNVGCLRRDANPKTCPNEEAPDADFSSSPALVDLKNGRQIIVAGNKGATVVGLDPDAGGKVLWRQSIGKSSAGGGILWGPATDGERVYAANAYNDPANPGASEGLTALDIATGRRIWTVTPPACNGRKPCKPAMPAAVTLIPGVIFEGTLDGQLIAWAAADGKLLWQYNTARAFETVNGVKGNGGSISNGGAIVVGGMVYSTSGYSHHGGIAPGNVLLAFSTEGQ